MRARTFGDARELTSEVHAWTDDLVRFVAPSAPDRALALVGRMLNLDGPLLDHCDDSRGRLGDALRQAAVCWLDLAARVRASGDRPELDWVRAVVNALGDDAYGVREPLLSECSVLLHPDEIRRLADDFEREARRHDASEYA